METLNRYIDGGSKRDQTTDLAWYREFVTRNTVSSRMIRDRDKSRGDAQGRGDESCFAPS